MQGRSTTTARPQAGVVRAVVMLILLPLLLDPNRTMVLTGTDLLRADRWAIQSSSAPFCLSSTGNSFRLAPSTPSRPPKQPGNPAT